MDDVGIDHDQLVRLHGEQLVIDLKLPLAIDRDMLENLVKVREGIETQEDDLKSQQTELADLKEQKALLSRCIL